MSENRSSSGPPPLCPLLQEDEDYDAWVLAGGRLFRAHTSVLASHSGYLRAAAVGAAGGGERDIRLLLPHVPPAGFAAILTYMYTGRLPLTPSTLYEVSAPSPYPLLHIRRRVTRCNTPSPPCSGLSPFPCSPLTFYTHCE